MTGRPPSCRRVSVGVAALLLLGVDGVWPCELYAQDAHGIREFTESTTWRVPAGVTHIIVELWGAGGGGAAGTSSVVGGAQSAGGGGGGGGSGAYVRASLAVSPGETYTIKVGAAGAAGRDDARVPEPGQTEAIRRFSKTTSSCSLQKAAGVAGRLGAATRAAA